MKVLAALATLTFSVLATVVAVGAISDETHAYTAADTDSSAKGSDRVSLRSITALSFSVNGRTRSQQGRSGPELRCVGGSASGFWWFFDYYPDQVQCQNVGWDGDSVQWACAAPLKEFVQFGPDTSVVCEPYNEDDSDGFVLRGSCRLDYTLNFSKFHVTSVHIIYGCVLLVLLFWVYFQTRFMVHRHLKRLAANRAAARRARKPSYL